MRDESAPRDAWAAPQIPGAARANETEVAPERGAHAIDIKAQDTALGERFVGGKRGLGRAAEQAHILLSGPE